MTIRPARLPDEVPAVRDLFEEYAAGLSVSLCFQNFDVELANLPGAYAPPAFRGRGIGRRLLETLLAEAVSAGYREAVFDTLDTMTEALALYRTFDFAPTEPYSCHPVAGSLCFRKTLISPEAT